MARQTPTKYREEITGRPTIVVEEDEPGLATIAIYNRLNTAVEVRVTLDRAGARQLTKALREALA